MRRRPSSLFSLELTRSEASLLLSVSSRGSRLDVNADATVLLGTALRGSGCQERLLSSIATVRDATHEFILYLTSSNTAAGVSIVWSPRDVERRCW
jgi:hypothetical protein